MKERDVLFGMKVGGGENALTLLQIFLKNALTLLQVFVKNALTLLQIGV